MLAGFASLFRPPPLPADMGNVMIRLNGVTKGFHMGGVTKMVARDATIDLPKGKSIALLGRNGAGKSTLMSMLAGEIRPDQGEILINGSISWPVGFMGSFHPDLTGAQNMRFLARVYGVDTDELAAFVEDFAEMGEPTLTTAVMIASVRRDYLGEIMRGTPGDHILDPATLPAKTDELAGFVWLPRIIAKARAKLRGELDPNTMYSCGGDRAFLRRHDIAPADFLRAIWAAGEDDAKVIDYVRRNSKA